MYEEAIRNITLNADASLASYTGVPGTPGSANPNYGPALYRFVKLTARRTAGLATAAADKPTVIGVCQSKPQVLGEATTVAIRGISQVMTGGVVTAGESVKSDTTGRAITSSDRSNELGIAIETSTGANQLIPVLLRVN